MTLLTGLSGLLVLAIGAAVYYAHMARLRCKALEEAEYCLTVTEKLVEDQRQKLVLATQFTEQARDEALRMQRDLRQFAELFGPEDAFDAWGKFH